MVQLIVGEKGKGKTKFLLERANDAVKTADGNIVYIDKNAKHMYELSNKIRLIDASRYPIRTADQFIGFICGVASQDHDLEKVFLDSFLTLIREKDDAKEICKYIMELDEIGKQFKIDFIVSVSKDKEFLDPALHDFIDIAL